MNKSDEYVRRHSRPVRAVIESQTGSKEGPLPGGGFPSEEEAGSDKCCNRFTLATMLRNSWRRCWWWCLVAQSGLTLCEPMDCSMPGFPVLPCLLEFA